MVPVSPTFASGTLSATTNTYICSSAHWVVGGRRGMSPNSGVLVLVTNHPNARPSHPNARPNA